MTPVPESEDFQLPRITPAAGADPAAAKPEARGDEDRHQDKYAQIAGRSGTRFKGFCPVVLRDDRDLADADPAFSSTYDWQEYQFSSAAAKATFDADPEKYVPAAGGDDVVLTADGAHVAGSIDHAVWYKNRLYLFSSRESMRKFVTEPATFARDE